MPKTVDEHRLTEQEIVQKTPSSLTKLSVGLEHQIHNNLLDPFGHFY